MAEAAEIEAALRAGVALESMSEVGAAAPPRTRGSTYNSSQKLARPKAHQWGGGQDSRATDEEDYY